MRLVPAGAALFLCFLEAQDVHDIVRKSIELDQGNWLRMRDYMWIAQLTERRLDSAGRVQSEHREQWETVVLSGKPYRRVLERDGKPLAPGDQRKQQRRLDDAVARLDRETPSERERRIARYDEQRRKDRAFLSEIPDAYDFRSEGTADIDGHPAWVVSAVPRPGYQPRAGDAKAFPKIRGKLWIDQAEYQWVRLEAVTTDTISFGWVLARLDPGASLVFEQTRVNGEVWLPKRQYMRGTGRVGLVKRVAMDQEITWTGYRKFRVQSNVIAIP